MTSAAKPLSIWHQLKSVFESGTSANKPDPERENRLAAAVLMVEVARADNDQSSVERVALIRLLIQRFGLSQEEAEGLTRNAERSADEAISLDRYLATLNERLDQSQKRAVFKMLWEIAYADNRLDPYEEHLLRQIADLLHLGHDDFIRLKLEVLGQC